MKNLLKKLGTIPNLTSLSRIPLGIIVLIFILKEYYLASVIVYTLAALTDALDGMLARKLKQKTKLGSLLDALADRIFIILVVVGLVLIGRLNSYLKLIILVWLIGETIFGLLIALKFKKLYLTMVHRNSIRYTAFFLYVTLGGVIIDFKYIQFLIAIVVVMGIYTTIDYILFVEYGKIKR